MDNINSLIKTIKDEFNDSFNVLKQEFSIIKKTYEEKMQEKMNYLEKTIEKSHAELLKFKENANDFLIKKDSDQQETVILYTNYI